MTQRSSEEWIRDLRGDPGREVQQAACLDLANYLYVVAYNYLRLRQADVRRSAMQIGPFFGERSNLGPTESPQETDAFGKVVFEDVAAADVPALVFEIAVA